MPSHRKACDSARQSRRRIREDVFEVIVRIDTPQELEYYRNGGILPYVLRQVANSAAKTEVRR